MFVSSEEQTRTWEKQSKKEVNYISESFVMYNIDYIVVG